MLQDLRFALRTLTGQPSFAVIAVLTLALGIGATTAIFTAVNAVLLRSLPLPEPERLYSLRTAMSDGRVTGGQVSPAEIAALNSVWDVVQRASGAFRYELSVMDHTGTPIKALGYGVTAGFFDVFGVPMALGRGFMPDEHVKGAAPNIVLSHRAWQTLFAGDPNIIGRSVPVEGGSRTVVGVAGKGFNFPGGSDAWFNLDLPPTMAGHIMDGYLRTKPGVAPEALRAALGPLSKRLESQYPAANAKRVVVADSLRDVIVGPMRSTLTVVFAAAALLLLISCVNVTSLLLSRGVVRGREIALRLAIGAQRGRIFRQLLTESTVLAAIGAAAGVAIAVGGLFVLLRAGASTLPRVEEIRVDTAVLTFGVLATMATGLLVGFAPALRLIRTDLRSLVNEAGRGSSGGPATRRLLNLLVIAEVALAVVLTVGAALLVSSFRNLQKADGGFQTTGRLVFDLSLPMTTYTDYDRVADFYARLLDRLAAIPGVVSAAATSTVPLGPELDFVTSLWFADTGQPPVEERLRARQRAVSPTFFESLGVKLVSGRLLAPSDRRDTPGVCVVDEAFVRRYTPSTHPIGRRIVTRTAAAPLTTPLGTTRPPDCEIVGVVRSVKFANMSVEPEPTFYRPLDQVTLRRQGIVLATSLADPTALIANVRGVVREADQMLSTDFLTLQRILDRSLLRQRLSMMLVTLFGIGALVLAAIGIYGVMAYSVAQRESEFAIRAALGAQPSDLRSLVLKQGLFVGVTGVVLGIATALFAGRIAESQLFGISPADPSTIGAVAVILLLIVLASTLGPAVRASGIGASRMLRG